MSQCITHNIIKKTRKTKLKVTGLEPGLQTEVCVLNTGQ